MEKKISRHMFTLITTIVVGAGSGIIAAAITQQSMRDYLESLTSRTDFEVITDVKPRALPDTYVEALLRVRETAQPAVVLLTPKLAVGNKGADIKSDENAISAVVVTSDGWLLAPAEAAVLTTAWIGGKSYPVTSTVHDPLSGALMIKIEARSLSAIPFGETTGWLGGEQVFALVNGQDLDPAYVLDVRSVTSELVRPGEIYSTNWELDQITRPGPLVDVTGSLVGIANDDGKATPVEQLRPFMESVLKSGKAIYAGLGVQVIDLSQPLNIDEKLSGGIKAGALILSPSASASLDTAVVLGSPAAKAHLKTYEIITHIDGLPLSAEVPLSLALKRYQPGDKVVVSFMNLEEGAPLSGVGTGEVEVTLVNLNDLLY